MQYLKVGEEPEQKYFVGQMVYLKDYSYSLYLTKDGFNTWEKTDYNQSYKILALNCTLPSYKKEETNDTILSGQDGKILFVKERFLCLTPKCGIATWKFGIYNTVTS
jgi:hypothetical protein